MKILIKFPTRNRVNQFFKVLDEYYNYSTNLDQIEFQITIDDDDLSMNNKMEPFADAAPMFLADAAPFLGLVKTVKFSVLYIGISGLLESFTTIIS